MKKITLICLFSFLLIGIMAACSSEAENEDVLLQQQDELVQLMRRGTIWDGLIGVDDGANGYVIVADTLSLKADLEDQLRIEGNPTKLSTIAIVAKNAVNDPADTGYMLIAADSAGQSIGVFLRLTNSRFYLDNEVMTSTSCKGCATGCNLEYLNIEGKKVAYCNENGCIYNCTKSETEFAKNDRG